MMEKKAENVSPPPSVGDYDDNQSTYTVDQPPPAYRKPDLPSVKMTKIVAATVLIVTLIAGITAVSIVYIQHNLKCAHYDALQQELSPEAAKIVRDQASGTTPTSEDQKASQPDLITSEAQDQLKKLNFPIHIDMDELTGRMMEKNQRARLNCVIEKKKTEEIIPRAPKTLQTPFGNLTTDPKFTHVTGETMSLTCRSGNERVSRPVNEKSSPILIQIPIQRGPPQPQQPQQQQQDRPSASMQGPRIQLPPMLPMPQHLQQHQGPSHQLPLQGPPSLFPIPQPDQSQQPRLLNNPFSQLRLPFMPFPQFPQIPLREVIPHLLEVHKQIQQQRQQEEDQQQQQRRNKAQHRQQESEESTEEHHQRDSSQEHQQQQQQQQQQQMQGERSRGRAIPMHDMPINRIIPGPPHAFMQQQHPNMPPPQHLRGPEPMMMHHEKQQMEQQQQQQQRRMQQEQQQQQQRHLQQEQQQQQHQQQSQEEEHQEHQHAGGPEIHLEGAPSFHNDMPHIVPAEMMERAGPLPFIIGSHNMQPRSSARPRMKRMAGECSCVCK